MSVEETGFARTLDAATERLEALFETGTGRILGDDAFRLYDTFGLPVELTVEMAAERGVAVEFLVKDATTMGDWGERFDSVIDCGLFHVFSDEDRRRYVEGLATVLKSSGRLFLMCFSDEEPGTQGPRRVSKKELHAAFAEGWSIESVEPTRAEVTV